MSGQAYLETVATTFDLLASTYTEEEILEVLRQRPPPDSPTNVAYELIVMFMDELRKRPDPLGYEYTEQGALRVAWRYARWTALDLAGLNPTIAVRFRKDS